ncbi:MAG TPA: 5-formyltetrahydrofolate cyclo-ligase [Candidatus Tectomicrobia bacterium]|nr:5-formyltetrahydrofolate cyclo-ligase [Candidatus Tectomicrobia bacterium]
MSNRMRTVGAEAKQPIRERVWTRLERAGVGRFPLPLAGRIPNFVGAEAAAARLASLPEWAGASTLKCNPDAPQRPVRVRALREGKRVFVAVPRLRAARPFLRLDPRRVGGRLAEAASIRGAAALGTPVDPMSVGRVDLIVVGSVAVRPDGARVGKGGGYSDLEFGLLAELGLIDDDTIVATTVHDLQLVQTRIPMTAHDVPVDLIVTPTRVVRVRRRLPRPRGILPDHLSPEQRAAIPVLADRRAGRRRR